MGQRDSRKEPEYRRQQKEAAERRDEAESHKENISAIAAVATGIDRVVTEHQSDRDQRERHESGKSLRDRVTIGALIAAAAAALLTLTVTHCDTRDLIQQSENDTKAIVRESNRVSTQQHTNTLESNRINREAYTAVQRAFVFVKELKFTTRAGSDPGNPGHYPEFWWFSPTIENSGNTPTKSLKVMLIASCGDNPIGIAFGLGQKQALVCEDTPPSGPADPEEVYRSYLSQNNSVRIISATLGPKSILQIASGFGVPPFYVDANTRVGKSLYYYGVIHYVDIFDGSHTTKFCFSLGANRTGENSIEPNIGICEHWNCIEGDQCDKDKAAYTEETKGWTKRPIMVIGAPSEETALPGIDPELKGWLPQTQKPTSRRSELPAVPHHEF
jgi:hypothetical protein